MLSAIPENASKANLHHGEARRRGELAKRLKPIEHSYQVPWDQRFHAN